MRTTLYSLLVLGIIAGGIILTVSRNDVVRPDNADATTYVPPASIDIETSSAKRRSNVNITDLSIANSQAIEFLRSVDESDRDHRYAAFAAAEVFVSEIDPDWIIRWRPVSVDPLDVFIDRSIRLSGGPRRQPVREIYLRLFNDIAFTAQNTRFEDNGSRAIWFGTIVSGGSGDVTISLAHDDERNIDAYVNISSDRGNFNIAPTKSRPFYVVAEANPYVRVRVD